MSTTSIEIIETSLFAATVADEIVASIEDAISDHGRCSFVLSGGKTPAGIYRLLARPPRVSQIEWSKVHLYWGDERWVAADDNQSNYKLAHETMLSQLHGESPQISPMNTALSSPEEAAQEYGDEISRYEKGDSTDIPQFDIVLLGLGEDGHTASLFPGSYDFEKEQPLCFVTKSPAGDSRLTLSPALLFNARRILFAVKGESKTDIVQQVLEGDNGEGVFPATRYRQAKGGVTWFLDSLAGKKVRD